MSIENIVVFAIMSINSLREIELVVVFVDVEDDVNADPFCTSVKAKMAMM